MTSQAAYMYVLVFKVSPKAKVEWRQDHSLKSRCNSSYEYPQHAFWLRNKKIHFLIMQSYLIKACIYLNGPGHLLVADIFSYNTYHFGELADLYDFCQIICKRKINHVHTFCNILCILLASR